MRNHDLPIFGIERLLLETLSPHKRSVLTAPTGSSKSTQVPQMLLERWFTGQWPSDGLAAAPV
ncbi:MAG: hypothetical protein ACREQW_01040, partial [Candidatus Binatia bacterium]